MKIKWNLKRNSDAFMNDEAGYTGKSLQLVFVPAESFHER